MIGWILQHSKYLHFFSSVKKNPYQVLGLKSNSSQQDIKKAYRILAHKYHPDKNPDKIAQAMFLDIKNAYQTLSDQDKRRQYDNQQGGSGRRSYGFQKDPFDEFKGDIYRDKSRVYHQTYTAGSTRRRKGEDIVKQITIPFIEAVKGTKVSLKFERRDTCSTCNGNKCESGSAPTRCLACGGSGSTVYRQGSIVMHLQCTRCNGLGIVIKNPCNDCKATGINVKKVEQSIEIPAGISSGEKLLFKEKGNQSQNGPSGDLQIKVNVEKHKRFRRVQNDIESTQWVTISQAALGTKKQIQTIWGKRQIQIVPGMQDGTKIKIKNQGVRKGVLQEGDHFCVIRIAIPTNLTKRQREIFQELSKEEAKNPYTESSQQQEEKQEESAFKIFKDIFK